MGGSNRLLFKSLNQLILDTMSQSNEFRKYAVHHMGMSGNALDSYAKHLNESPYTVTGMTPNVVEERPMRVTVIDVFSRLMADRIIFLELPLMIMWPT